MSSPTPPPLYISHVSMHFNGHSYRIGDTVDGSVFEPAVLNQLVAEGDLRPVVPPTPPTPPLDLPDTEEPTPDTPDEPIESDVESSESDPIEDAVESSESDPTTDVPEVTDTPEPASIIQQAKSGRANKGVKP